MYATVTTTARSNALTNPCLAVVIGLIWLTAAPRAEAQWAHLGGVFDISQAVDCNQTPTVAASPDGDFVVAWDRASSDKILARLYASDGTPRTGEMTLVSSTSARVPDAAMASDGSFVLTWEGLGASIRARRYSAAGVGLGTEQLVDTAAVTLGQSRVASAADGRFVVVWTDTDMGGQSIQARLYAADGTPAAASFDVRRQAGATPSRPRIAMQSNGDFTITWMETAAGHLDVLARRYDATGMPAGAAFVVHASAAGSQLLPDVATSESGELSIVWQGSLPSSTKSDAVETRFSAAGARISEILIGNAAISENSPRATLSNDGGTRFAPFLQRPTGSSPTGYSIRVAAGAQLDQALVGPFPEPVELAAALDDHERGVVVWRDSTTGCSSIRGQRVQIYRLLNAGTHQDRVHSVSAQEAWKFYVYFPNASPATVTFNMTLPDVAPHDADLLLQFGDFPSIGSHVCRSFNGGGLDETCTVDTTTGAPILVGVHGYEPGAIDFDLEVIETAGIFYDGFETGSTSAW